MKNHLLFINAICLILTLWSCENIFSFLDEDEDENEYEYEEFNPKKGEYYLFENDSPNPYEWDYQIYKDDTLISVKDDTIRREMLFRIGSATNDNDCIIFKSYNSANIKTGQLPKYETETLYTEDIYN